MSHSRQASENENRHSHSPLKQTSQEAIATRPISQVPYLNGVFDDEETVNDPHVIYVRETDSEYIRRCKLGGNRDLLVYIDPAKSKSKEPVAYARPLWWDAMCEDGSSLPLDTNDDYHQRKSSSQSKSKFSTPDRVIDDKHSSSPGKQRNTVSRLSQLSKNSKKK